MDEVVVYTAEHMKQIEDSTVVDGKVQGGNLVLVRRDGTELQRGNVTGPKGEQGIPGGSNTENVTSSTRPSNPTLGRTILETDTLNTLIWNGTAWKYVGNRAIVSSTTRPSGNTLHEGLSIYETDTDRNLTYINGAWVQQQANGELGYAQLTTPPSPVGNAITDIPGLSVTVVVGTRPIWIEFSAELQHTANGEGFLFLHLYEGSTAIQYGITNASLSGRPETVTKGVRLTPSAGSHTYKLRTQADASGVQVYPGTDHPAYISVREL